MQPYCHIGYSFKFTIHNPDRIITILKLHLQENKLMEKHYTTDVKVRQALFVIMNKLLAVCPGTYVEGIFLCQTRITLPFRLYW